MAFQLNEGQGSLFTNDKQGNPARPDLRGTILINGQTYFVSGWYKTSSNGTNYISLSAQPQQARPSTPQYAPQPQAPYGTPQVPPQYQNPYGQPQARPQYPQQFPPQPSQPMQQTGQFPPSPVGTTPGAEKDDMPAF